MNESMSPNYLVKRFFHNTSGTFTYVVYDNKSKDAVIIDPVIDYQASSASTSSSSVLPVIEYIQENNLKLHFVMETHAHADHLTGAQFIKDYFENDAIKVVIGQGITQVQKSFKGIFNLDDDFSTEGKQFDLLVEDGQELNAGSVTIQVMATPGHTNDSVTYIIGNAAFVGDTLFHPELGTARCDFPGGCAEDLYDSIQKIFSLSEDTRLFLCHDYPGSAREAIDETSIDFQKESNKHVKQGISKAEYVKMRQQRDSSLNLPALMIPSIQVNIRAGRLPGAESNGVSYLKYPLDLLVKK